MRPPCAAGQLTQARLRLVALQACVEFLNLGVQLGNLVVERPRAVGNRVVFLLNQAMATPDSVAHKERAPERPARAKPPLSAATSAPARAGKVHPDCSGPGAPVPSARLPRGPGSLSGRGPESAGNLSRAGIPFHPRVFQRRQGAGQFDAEVVLGPRLLVNGLATLVSALRRSTGPWTFARRRAAR